MAVQQAMNIYNQRKTDYVNRLVGTMREATNLCNGYAATSLLFPPFGAFSTLIFHLKCMIYV